MQTPLYKIYILFTKSVFGDDNRYTTNASKNSNK